MDLFFLFWGLGIDCSVPSVIAINLGKNSWSCGTSFIFLESEYSFAGIGIDFLTAGSKFDVSVDVALGPIQTNTLSTHMSGIVDSKQATLQASLQDSNQTFSHSSDVSFSLSLRPSLLFCDTMILSDVS